MDWFRAFIALIVSACACLTSHTTLAAEIESRSRIRVLTYVEYLSPDFIAKLKQDSRVDIDAVGFDDYEQAMEQLGRENFDIFLPSIELIPRLIASNSIKKINILDLQNHGNIKVDFFAQDAFGASNYAVPWHWGTTGLALDTQGGPSPANSYALLFDPPAAVRDGKIRLLDNYTVVAMALLYLGKSPCSDAPADLAEVERLLIGIRPYITEISNLETIEAMAEGRNRLHVAFNGDVFRARQKRPSLRYIYPREGIYQWIDAVVIPSNAKNEAGARAFMDMALDTDAMGKQSAFTGYGNFVYGTEPFGPANANAPEFVIPDDVRPVIENCSISANKSMDALWRRFVATVPPKVKS